MNLADHLKSNSIILVSILTIDGHLIEKLSLGRAGRYGTGCSESTSSASTRTASSLPRLVFSIKWPQWPKYSLMSNIGQILLV